MGSSRPTEVHMHRVCVVGTGYVGLPLAVMLSRNYPVVAFDVDREKIAQLSEGRTSQQEPGLPELLTVALRQQNVRFTSLPAELGRCDVKIFTVGTPYDSDRGGVDYSQLDRALGILGEQLARKDVIIVKSTVPPGTTEKRVGRAVSARGLRVPEDVGLVFSPERIVEGQALTDFARLPKIVGATDDRSAGVASEVLGTLGGSIRRVSSPTTAELIKMVDNYARYVFLGLTNEIALMCEKAGVDVLELIEAAKFEYPRNSGILLPGPGVGGSCLNKDPFILSSLMQKDGLPLEMVEAAARVNRMVPSHIADLVFRFAGSRRSVTLAGVAFKRDTDDTRFTPSIEIARDLRQGGFSVKLSDPYARLEGTEIERDLLTSTVGAEILLTLTDHSIYQSLELSDFKRCMAPNPLIVDTRGMFDRSLAEGLGFEYHGYGRL
jgi:dTDP-alpha-D-glucose dehydrogenase